MDSDSEVIRGIRKGDVKQFESLFRSSYAPLVRYAKSIVKEQDAAEEIVQDLFFRLWYNRKKIKIEVSINGYLFRAVHNRCLHMLEHKKVVKKHAEEIPFLQPQNEGNPSEIVQYNELQMTIIRVLERLPDRCGRIFCMNRFDGLKYSEIAEKLSVSVKTVEADMGKALKEFRRALKEQ